VEKTVAKRVGALIALIAFAAVVLGGALRGADPASTLANAFAAMAVFYLLGYLGAWVSFRVVSEGLGAKRRGGSESKGTEGGAGESSGEEREGG